MSSVQTFRIHDVPALLLQGALAIMQRKNTTLDGKMSYCSSDDPMEKSPWMCHVCDYTSDDTDSQVCDLCYRVTCELHLKAASVYNPDNGLYETARVCIECGSKVSSPSPLNS